MIIVHKLTLRLSIYLNSMFHKTTGTNVGMSPDGILSFAVILGGTYPPGSISGGRHISHRFGSTVVVHATD